jgi:hypothetical protein
MKSYHTVYKSKQDSELYEYIGNALDKTTGAGYEVVAIYRRLHIPDHIYVMDFKEFETKFEYVGHVPVEELKK